MHEVPTELGFSKARRTRVEVLVSKARRAFPRNPLCPCCRRVDPSTRWATRFDPKSHGITIGKPKSNIQGGSTYPENDRKKTIREWVPLVWKMMPHLVASFWACSRPPCGHIRPKSENVWNFRGFSGFPLYFPIGAGQPFLGLFTLVYLRRMPF